MEQATRTGPRTIALRDVTSGTRRLMRGECSIQEVLHRVRDFTRSARTVHLAISTLQRLPCLPALRRQSCGPCVTLITYSPRGFTCYCLDGSLITVCRTKCQATRLVFFYSLLHYVEKHSRLGYIAGQMYSCFFETQHSALHRVTAPLGRFRVRCTRDQVGRLRGTIFQLGMGVCG